jgi:hypothetical protein
MSPDNGPAFATRLRESAAKLLESDTPDAGNTAADLLKTASDLEYQEAAIEKLILERQKLAQDLRDSRRFWGSGWVAATPLITSCILAGTLGFQIWQGAQQSKQARAAETEKQNELLRQEERAEQARFTEALKTISADEKISPAAILLNSFTREPQKGQARQMALKLLRSAKSEGEFEALFSGNLEPLTRDDLPMVVQLDRDVAGEYFQLSTSLNSGTAKVHGAKKLEEQSEKHDLLSSEIFYVSGKIAILLKLPRKNGSEINLSNATITGVDLKGVDLRGADLSGVDFTSVNFERCDLSDITRYDTARFYYSPWWHASRISNDLLTYLKKTDPFRPGEVEPYAGTISTNSAEYLSNITRLGSK